ncbi:MAG TPA: xanthine dehydrogenase family protein subunit M [Candidatus Dormibacteraeota bacterium]|nr:xanthine dehydrogenase family protein subunit M [Candidatus Dormibacteraeota bacterium]
MISAAFEYAVPKTLAEAIALLRRDPGGKILAGGQSLIPMMRFRLAAPSLLIDITRIPELHVMREEDGALRIGAAVSHAEIENAALIAQRYPLLASTAAVVADPVVRNRGTLCGSLVHADPAGDWGAALIAARAEVVIAGPAGERRMPLEEFLIDTFTTALGEDEVLAAVRVPTPGPRSGGSYLKIERKVGDFATAAVGVQLTLDAQGRVERAGIGLCAAGPVSLRAAAAEQRLIGKPLDDAAIASAGQEAAAAADPAADTRGPVDFKKDMFRVLTVRALRAARAAIAG